LYRAGFQEDDDPNPSYTADGVRRSLGWLVEQLVATDAPRRSIEPTEETARA
jgi:hypothetical protein